MRKHTILLILLALSFPVTLSAGENIPGLSGGYQDGFYLKSADDRFLLKVGTRLNFVYTYGWVSPDPDFSSFDVLHAKFFAGGHAFGQTVQYYVQAAAGTHTRSIRYTPISETANGRFTLEDYYARLGRGRYALKLGQFKVPFSRQAMTYSGNLGFVNRSLATRYFSLGRDRGITLHYDQPTIAFALGAFNGGGTPSQAGGLQPSRYATSGQNVSNDSTGDLGHLFVARWVISPNGATGYSEGDVQYREGHRFDLGASVAYDFNRPLDFDGDLVVDDVDADMLSLSGEVVWKSGGLSFQGEYFFRKLMNSTLGKVESMGFYAQPAAFAIPDLLEFAARYSWLDPDTSTDDVTLMETSASLNLYYFSDHRYKTQLQYTWRREESPTQGKNHDHFVDLLFQLSL